MVNLVFLAAGVTERAVRTLSQQLRMSHTDIRRALDQGERPEFDQTALYQRVFALADKTLAEPAPRAILPDIDLKSPKISRKLTTAWFARRVEQRRVDCLRRASES